MKIRKYDDEIARQYIEDGIPRETYLYRSRESGELIGLRMTFGEKMEREKPGGFIDLPDGTEAYRALSEELAGEGISMGPKPKPITRARWPMTSVNAGVNPDQADELREHWRQHGVLGCDINPDGDVIWESPAARKKDCESRGLYDRDGGYGDPQGKNV